MVKMYKGKAQCTADRNQVATMQNAGWSLKTPEEAPKAKTPKVAPVKEVAKEAEPVKEVAKEAEPVKEAPKKAAPKKAAPKKRRSAKKAE